MPYSRLKKKQCRFSLTIAIISPVLLVMTFIVPRKALCDAVYGWGYNGTGDLGYGAPTPVVLSPTANPYLSTGVSSIAIDGGAPSCGMAVMNGAVYAWGRNDAGQLGLGYTDDTTGGSQVPIPIANPYLTSGVTSVANSPITNGRINCFAVKNGGVYSWGDNGTGALGLGNTHNSAVPLPINSLSSGVTAVAAGGPFAFAVKNGAAYSWGIDLQIGNLGLGSVGSALSPTPIPQLAGNVSAISTSGEHSMAIMGGAVYAWGFNSEGQLGIGNISSGKSTPTPITTLTAGVTAIAAGVGYSLAVKDGQVYAWGNNDGAQLGLGETAQGQRSTMPKLVPGLDSIVAVAIGNWGSVGDGSSYALSSDGTLWVWGDNYLGELGLGFASSADSPWIYSPQQVLPPEGYRFTGIAANGDSALATVAPVPEPTSVALLGGGLVALMMRRRRNLP
jgi:alpha-tubulin suppressor-like RCC1 family protein